MQLVHFPPTHTDMRASMSLTGVTILKETRYTTRHSGYKNVVQRPYTGFALKSKDPETIALKAVKPKKKKVVIEEPNEPKPEKKKQTEYTINKKEIAHRIRNYVNQMPGKKELYFWTITFPVGTCDDVAFVLMNKWLTRLRTENMIGSYLWVTERQENKTIHFHMAMHRKMFAKKANKYMRACIMHCINAGEINYSRHDAMIYNGVDISKNRKNRKVTNFAEGKNSRALVKYLTKYVTKNDGVFHRLAWHCSRDYSNIIISVRMTDKEFTFMVSWGYLEEKICFEGQYYEFYKWKKEPPPILLQYLKMVNNLVLDMVRSESRNGKEIPNNWY